MTPDEPERTAVIVIRAWTEEDDRTPSLRARVTWTLDVSRREEQAVTFSAIEDVVMHVRRCLAQFLGAELVRCGARASPRRSPVAPLRGPGTDSA